MKTEYPVQADLNFTLQARPVFPCSTLPDEVLQIIGYLYTHAEGIENAKTARQIAEGCHWLNANDDRKVRHLISCHHDRLPVVVCGKAGKGFFITTDPEKMAHYERTLYALLKAASAHIHAFRRNAARNGYRRVGSRENVTYQPTAA